MVSSPKTCKKDVVHTSTNSSKPCGFSSPEASPLSDDVSGSLLSSTADSEEELLL